MHGKLSFQTKSAILAANLLVIGSAHSALVAVNFAADEETAPTAGWTSSSIPESVPTGGWQNFTDNWSGTGLTLPAGSVNLTAYWDASVTWHNGGVASDSPYRGYLDDGDYDAMGATTSWAIQISGLSSWMTANGSSEWRLVLLRSSDAATAFRNVSIHTGTTTALVSVGYESNPSEPWATNPGNPDNWPNGGTAGTITNGAFTSTTGGGGFSTTNVFIGNSDAFIIRDPFKGGTGSGGTTRGSIAGFVLYTVPEPGSSLVAGLALGGLALRRRRR